MPEMESCQFVKKVNIYLPYDFAIAFYPKKNNAYVYTKSYT